MNRKKRNYPKTYRKVTRLPDIPSGHKLDDHFPERAILHSSGTKDYAVWDEDFNKYGSQEILEWHKQKGQKRIGYHYVIRRDGTIEKGRGDFEEGFHTFHHNYRSLGICLIGTRFFMPAQLDSLEDLCVHFRYEYGIPPEEWFGHCEYDPDNKPNCPGLDMDVLRNRFRDLFGNGKKGSISKYNKRCNERQGEYLTWEPELPNQLD